MSEARTNEPRDGGPLRPEWQVTADTLARYDRPGPRYTSYPTAVEFDDAFGPADYEEKLRALGARPAEEGLSLYVHLPFCDERCFFCGCNVIISPHKEKAEPYLDLLRRELALLSERLPAREVTQLHFGGGTPTYFSPEELEALAGDIFARFPAAKGAEVAIEVDPRVTSEAHLDALRRAGFNRISLGVQDFTPDVQKAIHRVQSIEETERIVRHARSLGFRGINIDLIYGLPLQTVETFAETVDAVVAMGADRAAVYSFAHVPWMHAHMKKIKDEDLPARELKFALLAVARETLLAAGYEAIGMDHFARPDDELALALGNGRLMRNFQGYSVVPAQHSVGLGISAIGDLCGAYVQNTKKLSRYREALQEGRFPVERGRLLSDDDELRRFVIRRLMCTFVVDVAEVESRFGIDFAQTFADDLALLSPYEDEGLVEVSPEKIEAVGLGRMFVRNLAMCFDVYLRRQSDSSRPAFSRTV